MWLAIPPQTPLPSLQGRPGASPCPCAVRAHPRGGRRAQGGAGRRLLLGELHRDLAREEVAPGQGQAPEKLDQQERSEKLGDTGHFQMLQGVCIQAPTTTIQTKVRGMNTFQPRRIIWS